MRNIHPKLTLRRNCLLISFLFRERSRKLQFLWPPIRPIFCSCGFSFFFFSSPILGGPRLDVYHTSTRCGLSANLESRSEMCCTPSRSAHILVLTYLILWWFRLYYLRFNLFCIRDLFVSKSQELGPMCIFYDTLFLLTSMGSARV